MSLESLLGRIKQMPPDVRKEYEHTAFDCPECNGVVVPQTMDTGICISCQSDVRLEDCEYEEEQ